MSTVTTDGSLNANIGGSIKSEVVELLFKIHFSHSGIGKFYAQIKLVLRDEKVEEVNFYSFVVVVVVVVVFFFASLGNAVMGEGRDVLWRLPIYIAVLLIFKKRFIRYGIMVFYINCLTTKLVASFIISSPTCIQDQNV